MFRLRKAAPTPNSELPPPQKKTASRPRWLACGAAAIGAAAGLAALGLIFAPYVYAELFRWLEPHAILEPASPDLGMGHMVDDYWAVQALDASTYAIGEPRYYQANYSYLIIGERRALLFDAGSGTRDIASVVARLTHVPVTVMPSHLHFDHAGGIAPFLSIAMLDLPETRADVRGGMFTPGRYQFLGMIDGLAAPTFKVTEWLPPGAALDLGGRVLQILHVPGHTHSSVALFDAATHRLFAGDFVYPATLYAFLPGASLTEYRSSTKALLATLPDDTIIWTAHCCRVGERTSAPWLAMADLRDLDKELADIHAGDAHATGFYPRRFPVNRQITLAAGFPWNHR